MLSWRVAAAGIVTLANYNSAKADYGSLLHRCSPSSSSSYGQPQRGGSDASGVPSILMLQVLSGLNMFPEDNFYRLIWGGVLLLSSA